MPAAEQVTRMSQRQLAFAEWDQVRSHARPLGRQHQQCCSSAHAERELPVPVNTFKADNAKTCFGTRSQLVECVCSAAQETHVLARTFAGDDALPPAAPAGSSCDGGMLPSSHGCAPDFFLHSRGNALGKNNISLERVPAVPASFGFCYSSPLCDRLSLLQIVLKCCTGPGLLLLDDGEAGVLWAPHGGGRLSPVVHRWRALAGSGGQQQHGHPKR